MDECYKWVVAHAKDACYYPVVAGGEGEGGGWVRASRLSQCPHHEHVECKRTSAQNNVYRTVCGSEAKYSSIFKDGALSELTFHGMCPWCPPPQGS